MQVLGMFACAMGAAIRVARCLVKFKWPVLGVLLLAPLVITWSLEVFALNGLGIFSWFLLARHAMRLFGRK